MSTNIVLFWSKRKRIDSVGDHKLFVKIYGIGPAQRQPNQILAKSFQDVFTWDFENVLQIDQVIPMQQG